VRLLFVRSLPSSSASASSSASSSRRSAPEKVSQDLNIPQIGQRGQKT
jgi:hypothetical protein